MGEPEDLLDDLKQQEIEIACSYAPDEKPHPSTVQVQEAAGPSEGRTLQSWNCEMGVCHSS